jgi:hypothetical protein
MESGCARVVRAEDGTLVEIVEILKEIFPNGLPNSSVVLLCSGTNL